MSQTGKWNRFTRYLAGECSEEERVLVERSMENDPEIRQAMGRLKEIWEASDKLRNFSNFLNMDMESEWKRLNLKIQSLETFPNENGKKSSGKLFSFKDSRKNSPVVQLLRVAAIILIMLGGGYVITQILYTESTPIVSDSEPEPHFREISTRSSQLAGLELTDGSKVNLSVESSLRLTQQYNRNGREVYLEGQAYFDVLSDPDRPFVVETSHAILTVLGTDFSIRSYPDDEFIQLVVVDGTVSMVSRVGNGRKEQKLTRGQMGLLNKMTGQISVSDVKAENFLLWMDGQIIFEETPLAQVCRDLERWFGITIEITDASLSSLRLTAEFGSRSLSHVLNVISHALNVDYELDDDRVWIKKFPENHSNHDNQ